MVDAKIRKKKKTPSRGPKKTPSRGPKKTQSRGPKNNKTKKRKIKKEFNQRGGAATSAGALDPDIITREAKERRGAAGKTPSFNQLQERIQSDMSQFIAYEKSCLSIKTAATCSVLSGMLAEVVSPPEGYDETGDIQNEIIVRLRNIHKLTRDILSAEFVRFLTRVGKLLSDKVAGIPHGFVANGLGPWLNTLNEKTQVDYKILLKIIYDTLYAPFSVMIDMVDTIELNIHRIILESQPYLQVKELLQNGIGGLTLGGTAGATMQGGLGPLTAGGSVSWSAPSFPVGLYLASALTGTENQGSVEWGEKIKDKFSDKIDNSSTMARWLPDNAINYIKSLELTAAISPDTVDARAYLHNMKDVLMAQVALMTKYIHNLDIINSHFPFKGVPISGGSLTLALAVADYNKMPSNPSSPIIMGQFYTKIEEIWTAYNRVLTGELNKRKENRMEILRSHPEIQQSFRRENNSISKYGGPFFGGDKVIATLVPQNYRSNVQVQDVGRGQEYEMAHNSYALPEAWGQFNLSGISGPTDPTEIHNELEKEINFITDPVSVKAEIEGTTKDKVTLVRPETEEVSAGAGAGAGADDAVRAAQEEIRQKTEQAKKEAEEEEARQTALLAEQKALKDVPLGNPDMTQASAGLPPSSSQPGARANMLAAVTSEDFSDRAGPSGPEGLDAEQIQAERAAKSAKSRKPETKSLFTTQKQQAKKKEQIQRKLITPTVISPAMTKAALKEEEWRRAEKEAAGAAERAKKEAEVEEVASDAVEGWTGPVGPGGLSDEL